MLHYLQINVTLNHSNTNVTLFDVELHRDDDSGFNDFKKNSTSPVGFSGLMPGATYIAIGYAVGIGGLRSDSSKSATITTGQYSHF